ncbi:hypothetical protein CEXT_127101 [Caerostris extrusa]|uniref:Uncharacterized protein n=1 Tax=Caerostris extrusa TaxID=172846 RepID=A0AAV4Y586_CAEEX|nr:hypothetical protein CEXT_127101 [Caerostris extrusa]
MSWAKHVTLHPVMPNNFGLYIPLPSQQESFKQLKISPTDYKAEDHSMHSSDAKLSPFIQQTATVFSFERSNRANLDYPEHSKTKSSAGGTECTGALRLKLNNGG